MDINLYKSERKTIVNVLSLYLSSTLLLIATLFTSYYFYKQEQQIQQEKDILHKYSLELEDALANIYVDGKNRYKYPRFQNFKSAIYDIDNNLIFSTLSKNPKKLHKSFFIEDNNAYLRSSLKPYYLGAAFMLIEKKKIVSNILEELVPLALFIIFVTIITSFFLVKLVLKPIRDNLRLLDNFIKDTTHELNTPITTILANIETLHDNECSPKMLKKLQRIKIASFSIANIYQDLVYILLNHKTPTKNENLNLSDILNERVQYFANFAKNKKIILQQDITPNIYFSADKQKIERLLDNILSNAVKYTKSDTTIKIKLTHSSLSIQDQGKGMSKDEIEKIFERYTRFDKTQGGFGIGYNIIKSITDEYKIEIEIKSQVNIGTEVILTW